MIREREVNNLDVAAFGMGGKNTCSVACSQTDGRPVGEGWVQYMMYWGINMREERMNERAKKKRKKSNET